MKILIKISFLVLAASYLVAANGWAANVVYVDQDNRVVLNGQPFFPIGLYVIHPTVGSGYISELNELENSPFDTVVNYAINEYGQDTATNADITDYLDALQARNLKTIFSLQEYFSGCTVTYGVCDDQEPLSAATINTITDKVVTHKDHDAVVAWYTNDESCPDCLTQLLEGYNLIKDLDNDHPIWSVHWNTQWLSQLAPSTHIIGGDPYPIPDNPITWVSDAADAATQTGKPAWLVLQIFDWSDYPWDSRAENARPPTYEEMRAMSYLATNHGAKGLIYYSYFDIRNDADYPQRWGAIKDIAAEIDQLRDIFLSTDQTNQSDITCNNPDIDFKLMKKDGTYYLFAVNTAVDAQGLPVPVTNVSFQVNLPNVESEFDVLFEDRQVRVNNGTFTDDFLGNYAVHVYQADTVVARNTDSGGGGGGGCFVSSLH